jgi:alkylhydroperoxidase family enzyme
MHPGARLTELAAAARRLRHTVLQSGGVTTPALRQVAFDGAPEDLGEGSLAAYVVKVRDHAYRITDGDLAELRADGLTDDAIFEVTVAAALGAADRRLAAGLALLDGAAR